jgi:ferric-dicitrate binding protein FerR (iron transport regulator)
MTERDRVDEAAAHSGRGDELERRAKDAFDRSAAALDAETRSRLTQARHRALEELPSASRRRRWQWVLAPAGALAAAAIVAVLVLGPSGSNNGVSDAGLQQAVALGDLELLLGDEDLEMYDEEIEFYAWLEEQPEFTPPAGDGVG